MAAHQRTTPLLHLLARLGWQHDPDLWTVRCRDRAARQHSGSHCYTLFGDLECRWQNILADFMPYCERCVSVGAHHEIENCGSALWLCREHQV